MAKRYSLLRHCWRFRLNRDGLLVMTPWFMIELCDLKRDPVFFEWLVTGLHIAWGVTSLTIEEGQIIYKHDYWYRRTAVTLWEIEKYGR